MKILIVQLRRIGDILLTTPVLSFLKDNFPRCQIDFLCEPMGRSVLENNPFLSHLLIYDKNSPLNEIIRIRKNKYDVVLDFLNNPRSSFITRFSGAPTRVGFATNLRSFFYNIRVPIPKDPEYVPLRKIRMVKHWLASIGHIDRIEKSYRPELYLSEEDSNFSARWLTENNLIPGSFIAMAPAHRHPIRQWRAEGFKRVALTLYEKWNLKTFLAWGPGEEQLMEEIVRGAENEIGVFPATSMKQMGAIIKNARLLVTNDSGTMHLGVAVRTPTVTIYGPTRPVDWNPSLVANAGEIPLDIALNAADLDCLGCHLHTCPIGHLCMKNLTEDRVIDACDRILKGR